MNTTTDTVHTEVRKGAYADSVTLLQVSKDVAAAPGVAAAQIAMATPLNLELLEQMGFDVPESTPNDMIVALRVDSPESVAGAVGAVDTALAAATRHSDGGTDVELAPRTTTSAFARGDASLALVSVPGASATTEAMDALDADRDVMIFSDNVPLEQEVALKRIADDRGLLVMGPDCGTAVIDGVGLGFANACRPGPVGIVAASGTGCQQLMCLLDAAGVGVRAALGVGGRDLSADVAGRATRQALRRLDADPAVEHIVVVSKPPAEQVAADLHTFARELATPVQFALLGPGQPDLTQSAESVLTALGQPTPQWPRWPATAEPTARAGYLRGLFVGGTMCDEATLLVSEVLGPVRSDLPLDPADAFGEGSAEAHVMVDFGADEMTAGRAHPMIDPALRLEHLAAAAADPDTGALLLDVVLGHGAEADPAAALAPAIAAARTDHDLPVVVACIGTDADPQQLTRQADRLAAAGAEVFLSNAAAVRRAIDLIGGTR